MIAEGDSLIKMSYVFCIALIQLALKVVLRHVFRSFDLTWTSRIAHAGHVDSSCYSSCFEINLNLYKRIALNSAAASI
jgi:hypothetical protein